MAKVTEAHLAARRDQIVGAAWSCFARKGYHQTTMQEIAEEAGLSAGAIYRYYPGKEAVLKAINERSQEMGRALLAAARVRTQGPLDVLQVVGRTFFSVFYDPGFETTTRINVEIWPEVVRNAELMRSIRQELTFWREAVVELLREAQRRGELRPEVDPEAAVVLFMCAFEGLRHYRLVDPEHFTPERVIDALGLMLGAVMRIELDKSGARGPDGLEAPFPIGMPRPPGSDKEA